MIVWVDWISLKSPRVFEDKLRANDTMQYLLGPGQIGRPPEVE